MDKEEFEKLKFSSLEPIEIICPKCQITIESCDNCADVFEPDMGDGERCDMVSCGKINHICKDCYDDCRKGEFDDNSEVK